MEKWKKRWDDNQLRWHKDEVDPFLIKYLSLIQGKDMEEKQSPRKRFFVPLCGKSLDIPYILSLGYNVFAVEGVHKAIETLSNENNLSLKFSHEEGLYTSPDKRIQVYCGDLFACPLEKWAPFDYVWDKGSLTAIDEEFRPMYKKALQKSLQVPGTNTFFPFQYLLRTVIYDKAKSNGKGPKCVSEDDMKELYGDWANIVLLESSPLPQGHILRQNVEIGLICHENIYLLTRKS